VVKAAAIRASAITPEEVAWLWPGRLPLGGVTLLAGSPGLGKSLLSIQLAAQVSRGLLDGEPGASLLLTAEDSHAHTVVPRLAAAGADLDRVYLGTLEDEHGFERQFQFPNDIGELEGQIRETEARLVVVDPLMAHLPGSVNSWQDQGVRRALAPLRATAESTGAAILIIGHLNKGQGSDPLQRIGGSVGIPAAARSVLLLERNPADPQGETGLQRVVAQAKSNLGPLAESLLFELGAGPAGGLEAGLIRQLGPASYTASELLVRDDPVSGSALQEAKEFLHEALRDGPLPVVEINEQASRLGIAEPTLKRARRDLAVKAAKDGMSGGWHLALPTATETAGA
jgi:hypothetical protein